MPRSWIGLCLAAVMICSGCVSDPYTFGVAHRSEREDCDGEAITVSRGRPNVIVDGAGWVLGIPQKILLWNSRALNHDVSPETEQEAVEYLAAHGLDDVQVRVNQYDPRGEWRRLVDNDRVAPGWKYTAGGLRWVVYTVLPDRVFGADYYNPFTNSLNIYSDIPEIAVREAAYARDIASRTYPGTYATFQAFRPISIWHQSLATNDALSYYAATGTPEEQQAAWEILAPQYGADFGNMIGASLAGVPISVIGGALVGHGYGQYRSAELHEEAPVVNTSHTDEVE
jgi:hypothetical protein